MAVSPDRRVLYVSMRSEPYAAVGLSIDAGSGTLEHVATGPLAASMAYISTDRTGRFLLSASYDGHVIAVNPIDPAGTVLPPTQVLTTEPHAHAILTDPSNRFVLATSLGGDVVISHRFDAAIGRMSPNTTPTTRVRENAGPRHAVFHPSGAFLYLLNELDATIDVFGYEAAAGRLEPVQTASVLPPGFDGKPWAADLHITVDGRFLYASERTSSTLAGFELDPASGTISLVGHTPTEKQPRAFAIDPAGRVLVTAGQLSNKVSAYGIDRDTGALARLGSCPVGANPNWVEIVDLP